MGKGGILLCGQLTGLIPQTLVTHWFVDCCLDGAVSVTVLFLSVIPVKYLISSKEACQCNGRFLSPHASSLPVCLRTRREFDAATKQNDAIKQKSDISPMQHDKNMEVRSFRGDCL